MTSAYHSPNPGHLGAGHMGAGLMEAGLMGDWGRGLLVAGFAGTEKTRRRPRRRASLAARLKRLFARWF